MVLLHMWERVLDKSNMLSRYLQTEGLDMFAASTLITSTQKDFAKLRTNDAYTEIIKQSKDFCSKYPELEIESSFPGVRQKKRKRMAGEIQEDTIITDPCERFRVKLYFPTIDLINQQMKDRFVDFLGVVSKYSCLEPSHFKDDDSDANLSELASFYHADVDSVEIKTEYTCLRNLYSELLTSMETPPTNVQSLLNFLIKNKVSQSMPNMCTLIKMYLSIPVSSVAAERSFSRMKLIKACLRNTMLDTRLSGLAVISINNDVAKHVDFDAVIDTFANMSVRRMNLT